MVGAAALTDAAGGKDGHQHDQSWNHLIDLSEFKIIQIAGVKSEEKSKVKSSQKVETFEKDLMRSL